MNNHDLADLLTKKIENCKIDWFSVLTGGVAGSVRGDNFNITVIPAEYLIISAVENSNVLEIIKPILVEFMNREPICSYDLVTKSGKLPTLEWELREAKNRINKLVNGAAWDDSEVENLKLFGYELSDFTSDEAKKKFFDAEAERVKNARIFGIDPGFLKPEEVEKFNEVDMWSTIDTLGYILWNQSHDESHGRVSHVDMAEQEYAIEYLIYKICIQLKIEVTEPKVDRHIRPSANYKKWYNFYSNHFKETLSDSEWRDYQSTQNIGGDVSKYMPKGSWKN